MALFKIGEIELLLFFYYCEHLVIVEVVFIDKEGYLILHTFY